MIKQIHGHVSELKVASVDEWDNLGQCLDISLGWQVYKFESKEDREKSSGYGFQDGATGSIALRFACGVNVAILLNCVDKDARHAGRDLLDLVAAHLGLQPRRLAMPTISQSGKRSIMIGTTMGTDDVIASLQKMEMQISRLHEVLHPNTTSCVANSSAFLASARGNPFRGRWESGESENLDAMFEALNVPAIARKLARNIKRVFVIEDEADVIKICTTTCIGPRKLEESEASFIVGEAFRGSFGRLGSYTGMARWTDASVCKALVLEKRFSIKGKEVVLEETYQLTLECRMSLETCIKGQGDVEIEILSAADRDHFCRCLDRSSLRLKTEAELTNGVVFRCGRVIAPESCTSFLGLTSALVPLKVVLRYEDIRSTTKFDLEGGVGPLLTPATSFSPSQATSSSMCSSWTSPSVVMEGFVWKRSRHLKCWRKRRLILTSDELKCFHDNRRATEVIPVRLIQQIRSADDVHPSCLCIKFGQRNIYFSFDDQNVKQKWLQELARFVSDPGNLIHR